MELSAFFKSVIEQDSAPVVICDLDHIIIYMNPSAVENYAKRGGAELIGRSLLDCHSPDSCEIIRKVAEWFAQDVSNNKVHTFYNEKQCKDVYMIALRDDNGALIGYYEKHEFRRRDDSPMYDI